MKEKPYQYFVFKLLIIIAIMILLLSIANAMSILFGLRPQAVLIYSMTGVGIAYVVSDMLDKLYLKKEDPLPDYVLQETELTKEQVEVMKKVIEEELGISYEEVSVRAKAKDRLNYEEANHKRKA